MIWWFFFLYVVPCLLILWAVSTVEQTEDSKMATIVAFLPVFNFLAVVLGVLDTIGDLRR